MLHKELDRTFGLDTYDVHARSYFAMLPMWDRVDPLAEKYYSPGTAGCIGIQGSAEALAKLGNFLYDYIKTQNKNIQINFIITGNPNYGNNGKANPNLGQ